MEITTRICWGLLAALHVIPSIGLFYPSAIERLYKVDPSGDIYTLLVHRCAMFFTVVVVSAYALAFPCARQLSTIVVSLSMVSFLIVYVRAGMPSGALQTIAIADLVGLLPLGWVIFTAWRPGAV